MDKQQLLEFYSSHYLSKQEIMFKLPFNISADAFWSELMNRRKMRATVLPLYNYQGKPYWYVMTEKMIKGSEILCEEAIKQENFDPYRMEMTTAMTWEMFFTSYVEGAQIDMDEAIEYLSKDAEPSDVQEQLLWNNRQAMSAMVGGIFHPIDEEFTCQLVYLLTQDMENTATSYRQNDTHIIAAMSGENYTVPTAYDIPNKMNDLFAFLSRSDTHPLIKAAVGQAYILTTRPFPEGNERLSRIISAMILYRSGYEFFRDISISRAIAKESYRYYQSMKNILIPESDGDITCFVEYFIDLLARALKASKEDETKRKNNKNEELIASEREMALVPLDTVHSNEADSFNISSSPPVTNASADVLQGANIISFDSDNTETGKRLIGETEFWNKVEAMCNSRLGDTRKKAIIIKELIEKGVKHFTIDEWASYSGRPRDQARNDCFYLRKQGIISNLNNGKVADYCFTIFNDVMMQKNEDVETQPSKDEIELTPELIDKITQMSYSENEKIHRIGVTALKLIEQGITSFSNSCWREIAGISKSTAMEDMRVLVLYGLAYKTGESNRSVYHFGISENKETGLSVTEKQEMIIKCLSERFSRPVELREIAEELGMKKDAVSFHIRKMMETGIIERASGYYPTRYMLTPTWIEKTSDNSDVTKIPVIEPEYSQIAATVGYSQPLLMRV